MTENNNIIDKSEFYNQQKEYFDKGIHEHLRYKEKSVYIENIIDHISRFINESNAARILELGCGSGRFTIPLLKRGFTIYGVDFSQRQLNQLRISAQETGIETERLKLYSCNIVDLNQVFGNERFHYVLGLFFLHHLPDFSLIFNDLAEIMHEDGQLIFVEPNRWCPLYLFQIAFCKDMSWGQERGTFKFGIKRTRGALKKFGFHKIYIKRFGLFPPQVLDNAPFMLRVERFIERLKIFDFFLPFILINAKKKTRK